MKGHIPANKGKKWSEYLSKRTQRRCAKGWKNLDLYRNKNGRSVNAGRRRRQVVAVMDDGSFRVFPFILAAAEYVSGKRENVCRCCRLNGEKQPILTTDIKESDFTTKAKMYGFPK